MGWRMAAILEDVSRSLPSTRRLIRAALVPAIICWRCGTPRDAGAEADVPLALEWEAAPHCSSAPEILAVVSHQLDGPAAPGRGIAAHVRLTKAPTGAWRVALVTQTEGTPRSRSFEAESCDSAVAGVAFILALELGRASARVAPSARVEANVAPMATAPSEQPPDEPPPPRTLADHSRPSGPIRDGPSVRWNISRQVTAAATRPVPPVTILAAVASSVGSLPHATYGAAIAVGLQPGHWRFELAGAYYAAQPTSGGSAVGARIQASSLEVRAAYGWPMGAFAAGPSANVAVDRLGASGFGGGARAEEGSTAVAMVGVGGFASWRVTGAWGLRLAADGELPSSRPSFLVIEPAPLPASAVYRLPALTGRALLGVDVVF